MYSALPSSSEAIEGLQWADIEPWYDELTATPLSLESVQSWLAQWSRLTELIDEALTRRDIACTQDTADQERVRRKQRFMDDVYRPAQPREQQLKERLLASGLEPTGFAIPLRNLRAEATLFTEANLPLLQEEQSLTDEYLRLGAAQTVVWNGEEVSINGLRQTLLSIEREQREQAWRATAERQLADRGALNALWVRGLRIRQAIARNAGQPSYRDYRWQQLLRFDYTPSDCYRFHAAVEQVVVPATHPIWEKRRQLLGVSTIRPWDTALDARGNAPARVFTNLDEVLGGCVAVFGSIHPRFQSYFEAMIQEGLCDLEERSAKANTGYNRHLEARRRPFIFGRTRTLEDVISNVFHEAGHAFQVFEMSSLPYIQQRQESALPLEFAEVASTSMELLGAMYLHQSGLCTASEEARVRSQHFERFVTQLFPLAARGDAFQHWVYEDPERAMDIEACDQKWAELSTRFLPNIDWRGLEAEQRVEWQRVRHFYGWPFYYVEYALAALGALQIWDNYTTDPQTTIDRFRSALSLGATKTVPELFADAGATFAFDTRTLGHVVKALAHATEGLEAQL